MRRNWINKLSSPLEKFHQAIATKSSSAARFTSAGAQYKFCYFFHLQEKSKAKKWKTENKESQTLTEKISSAQIDGYFPKNIFYF
jgi:hypothetical protein